MTGCFGGFMRKGNKNKKKDDFESVDKFLVDYAIKYQLYTPPSCALFRNRLAYVVQWKHLKTRSELIDFKIIPQEGLNGQLLSNVDQLMNNNSNNNQGLAGGGEGITDKASSSGIQNNPDVSNLNEVNGKNRQTVKDKVLGVTTELTSKLTSKKKTKSATIDSLEDESPHEMDTRLQKGQIEIRSQQETERDEKPLIQDKPQGKEMSLFKTEYTNSSGGTQKFTFQTERRTTSSVNVNVQKSYTIGGQLDLSFAIPIDTISLSGEYQVSKSKDESFSKEQVWTVNNEVEVNPGEKVIAEMKVMEEQVLATFKIKNTISMMPLSRYIPIHVVWKSDLKKHPEDRKVLDVFSLKDHNLHKAFINAEAERAGIEVNKEKNTIEFVSEGVMDMVYQSRQVIDVRLDMSYNADNTKPPQAELKKEMAPVEHIQAASSQGMGDGKHKKPNVISEVKRSSSDMEFDNGHGVCETSLMQGLDNKALAVDLET